MSHATTYQSYGCGASPLPEDWRDHAMERVPGIAEQAAAGVPDEVEPLPIGLIYNQGKMPACVCYSLALLKSIQEQQDFANNWLTFDALLCYRENGGDGRAGVPIRKVLKDVQKRGMLDVESGTRYNIDTYVLAPQQEGLWEETVKAALAAGHPVVVALLLPEMLGWDSSGERTNSYHQMCAVGYTKEHLTFANSWGNLWGRGGLCRVPWAYLMADRFQGGLCYAYTVTDARNAPPEPPAPPSAPIFQVGGYVGLTGSVGSLQPGALLQVVGDGLDAQDVRAYLGLLPLEVVDRQPRLVKLRLPESIRVPIINAVRFERPGYDPITGPLLVVEPRRGEATPPLSPQPISNPVCLSVTISANDTITHQPMTEDVHAAYVRAREGTHYADHHTDRHPGRDNHRRGHPGMVSSLAIQGDETEP